MPVGVAWWPVARVPAAVLAVARWTDYACPPVGWARLGRIQVLRWSPPWKGCPLLQRGMRSGCRCQPRCSRSRVYPCRLRCHRNQVCRRLLRCSRQWAGLCHRHCSRSPVWQAGFPPRRTAGLLPHRPEALSIMKRSPLGPPSRACRNCRTSLKLPAATALLVTVVVAVRLCPW